MPRRSADEVCPDENQHTPAPDGYVAWHEWAARKSRTHSQRRCPGCGLYKIWIPRTARTPGDAEEATDG